MPHVAPATGAVFIRRRSGAEVRSACPEVSVPPVLAGDTRCGSVPYYEQETNYTCGPAVAQMWIDSHNGYVSQDTLWDCILDSNREEGVVHRHVRARGLAYPATVRPGSNGFVGIMVFLQR